MALIDPPAFLGLAGNSYTAARLRRVQQLMIGGREGCLGPGDMVVTQTGTPGLSVQVAAGAAVVNGDDAVRQGAYVVESDGPVTVGPVSTPHATLARIDRLVLEVLDQEGTVSGGGGRGSDLPRYRIVAGTPSSSPAPPAEPPTAITLALITVGAGASALLNAAIADARTVLRVAPTWQTADLADSAVTAAKVLDGAITTGKIADSAVTAAKVSLPMTWIGMTLTGGPWSNFPGYGGPEYCIDPFGFVHLRGVASYVGSGAGSNAYTFPVGFRPPAGKPTIVQTLAGTGTATVSVSPNGLMSVVFQTEAGGARVGSNTLYLEGVAFHAS